MVPPVMLGEPLVRLVEELQLEHSPRVASVSGLHVSGKPGLEEAFQLVEYCQCVVVEFLVGVQRSHDASHTCSVVEAEPCILGVWVVESSDAAPKSGTHVGDDGLARVSPPRSKIKLRKILTHHVTFYQVAPPDLAAGEAPLAHLHYEARSLELAGVQTYWRWETARR